ncbi:MAG: AI-2E family transporter [Candidatus Moraniibacteriota bacterium]|nr:MAG: AI-2E family transporter [Candidatus Moranbacteria bacterium]
MFIFLPFMIPIIIAGVLASIFFRVYEWFWKKAHLGRIWGSLVSCLAVFLIIVIPFVLIVTLVTKEAYSMMNYFSENPELLSGGVEYFQSISNNLPIIDQQNITSIVKQGGALFVSVLQKTYSGLSHFFFSLFVMFFSLFYFFIDGKKMVRVIMNLSPLREDQEKELVKQFVSISKATLKGTIIIGFIQGILGAILFSLTGVPSPVTWGVVMMVSALIPAVGSGLVWIPVGVSMLLSGNILEGVIILSCGAGIISTIDNILRPRLVGRDSQMHPLLVFFATLGGIILFGIFGFIIGPIVVSLFLALIRIYEREFSFQLKEYNGNSQ